MKYNKNNHLCDFIFVGDTHVKKDNIEESKRLINWINDISIENGNIPILFAGDQYNDFGVARVEVTDFWVWAFNLLQQEVIALVGNHDANPDMSMNFMSIHQDAALIINKPTWLNDNQLLLLPFMRDNKQFEEWTENTKAKNIICHQEFDGALYENGFYSPNGIKTDIIGSGVELVVSGHIHKEQRFGKIWYPGNPRHITRSDIGEVKGIWKMNLKNRKFDKILTPSEVCEPFSYYEITEKNPKMPKTTSSRVFIDIKGDEAFVKKMIKKAPESAKVRTFVESLNTDIQVKESEGIPKAFFDYVLKFADTNGLGQNDTKLVLNMIYDRCPTLKVAQK